MEKKWLLVFLVVLLLVFSVVLVFSDVEEDSFLGEVKSYLVSDEEVLFSPGMIDTKKVISGGEEILEGETTQRGEILDSLNEQLFDEEDVLYFSLPSSIEVDSIFDGTFEESIKIQVDYDYPVAGVSVSGNGEIFSKGGYARVLAEGEDNNVHLIFASDFLGLDDIFDVENFCEWETCHLPTGVVIKYLIIEIKDGYLKLDGVYALREDSPDASRLLSREDYKFSQEGIKVERWNDVISEKGFKWIADETSVSGLSYVEKKKLFGGVSENGELFNNGELPNTFGFEYYKGGIFEIPSEKKTEVKVEEDERVHMSPSNLPPYWDWREVHGENWVTPVKDQRGCGSCWAFASAGATELLVNLYFNQHIDLDLSEQELVSCMPDGDTCNGYWPRIALDYVINNGIVEENCFPYQATDPDGGVPCTQRCNNPVELISITGRDRFDDSNEETLKGMITNNGGVSGGIYSWGHAMNLIGYDKDFLDEETVWIFKNSWGEWWGENGYGRIKTDITDIGWTHALLNPVFSDEVLRQIACADNDGDGYCNWGISETKPGTCPAWCEEEKDCDDDDPNTIECYTPRCDDGIDNDNDGYVDYPDDFGCSSVYDYNEENNGDSECNDGIDNNFNGLIDQEDSMCDSWDDNDEERACEDGIDNDGDGTCDLFGCWIDETWFPKDPECSSYNDPYEDMIAYCPEGFEVYTENYPDDSRCVYSGYNNHLNYDDTLNYCEDENAWLPYSYELSQFCWQLDLRSDDAAGFVRVADPFSSGHKNWHDTGFHFSSPECGDVEYDHCGTRKMNSECEIVEGLYGDDQEAGFVCLKMPGYRYPFECQDGIDNDNDLYTDYPEDPSCDSPEDDSEAPFDPGRTECSNGFDEDQDGAIDYPSDYSCYSPEDDDETNPKPQCKDGADNDGDWYFDMADPQCFSMQDEWEELIPVCQEGWEYYSQTGKCLYNGYNNHLNYDDSVAYCQSNSGWLPNAVELTQICDDFDLRPESETRGKIRVADERYDGHKSWHDKGFHFSSPECGDVVYDFCGTLGMNSNCEWVEGWQGDDQEAGFVCLKMPGYRYPFECQDGIDNDNDLYTDYPEDPSCDSPEDDSEAPFDPGRTECSNGFDEDQDGAIDYPDDFSCNSYQDNDEFYPEAECQDGIDNDNDSFVDYPDDPQCYSLQDNYEGRYMAVFTSGNGDGDVYNWGQETWEEIHDADAGFNARYSGIVTYVSGSYYPETEEYSISRAFLPFDTSSIPNNAQVMSASLSFWTYDWINNNDNDGNDFITLVQTTQYSPNSLNIEDYDECGFVDNPIEGSERIDISTLSENIKYKIDLNTEGVSWVDKQGWTLLGMREGHDVLDIVPIDRSFLNIQTSQSENPPELIVTYIWDPTVTQCSDGIDNDNDGAIDYPNDFSCDSLEDEDETNPMAQCQDGIDNDNDGFVDLADPSCDSLQDDMEFPIDGWWDCGNGVLDEGEECDDGNNVYGDGCSFTCHLEDDILWDNFEPPNGEINPPITLPDEWRAPYVMSSENTAQAEGWSADDMILDECVIVEQVDWIGWRTLHVAANYPFVEVVILDNDFETVYEFTDLFYENTTFPWGGHFDGYDNVVYEGRVSLDDVVLPAGHYYVGTRLFSSLPGRNYAAVSANETENLQGNTMGIFKSDFFNYPGKPDWVFTEQLNNNPIYDYAFRVRGAVHPDQSSSECGGGPLAIGKETSTEIRLSPEEREAGIVEKIINWIKGLF